MEKEFKMKKIFALSFLLTLPFSQTALSQDSCSQDDAPCLARLAARIAEGNSQGQLLGVIALAAAGYGIYKLSSSNDTPEEAKFRAQELSNGYGLRLNNINAPLRISIMRRLSYNTFGKAKEEDENQGDVNLNMLHIEYNW